MLIKPGCFEANCKIAERASGINMFPKWPRKWNGTYDWLFG